MDGVNVSKIKVAVPKSAGGMINMWHWPMNHEFKKVMLSRFT
jgi:hypothetical protein